MLQKAGGWFSVLQQLWQQSVKQSVIKQLVLKQLVLKRLRSAKRAKAQTMLLTKHPTRHPTKLPIAWFALALIATLLFASFTAPTAAETVTVRVNRWLAIRQLSGDVTYLRGATSRRARVGDRLQRVGDGLSTGMESSASLEVDTRIGTVEVGESTKLQVQSLEVTETDGHITRLRVDQGRVRLQIRQFTNPDSRLEIDTRAGISGVRGTEFGVNVFPDGKMGVATLEGSVLTSAQAQDVEVPAGFQNITIPGEPPSPPVPFTNEPRLDYQIERIIRRGIRRIQFTGQVDPTSSVLIQGQPQPIDRDGRFNLFFPAPSRLRRTVTVITPLGQEQTYELQLI